MPGKDGLVCVATIQTPMGVYVHPVTKLVPLFSEGKKKDVTMLKNVQLLLGGMFALRPGFATTCGFRACIPMIYCPANGKSLNKSVVVVRC